MDGTGPSLQHFTILPCWAFLRDFVFDYFIVTSVLFVPCGNDVIFSILEDRSARHYCCVYILHGIFSFLYSAFFNLGGSSIPT
jgi:hypothetical protein